MEATAAEVPRQIYLKLCPRKFYVCPKTQINWLSIRNIKRLCAGILRIRADVTSETSVISLMAEAR